MYGTQFILVDEWISLILTRNTSLPVDHTNKKLHILTKVCIRG